MSGLNTIAKLSLVVDTTQLESANKHLDKLSEIASKVETSGSQITTAMDSTAETSRKAADEQEKLAAKLMEMINTYKQGREGVIEYRAAMIGATGVIKPLLDQYRQMKESTDAHNQATKEQLREESRLERERSKLVAQHKEYVATLGMSRDEIRAYKLEQAGLVEQADELRKILKDNSAQAKAAEQQKVAADAAKEYQQALQMVSDSFTTLNEKMGSAGLTDSSISGLKKELKDLEEFAKQLESLGDTQGLVEVEKKVKELEKTLSKTADPKKKDEVAKLSEEFAKMRGKIDPVQGALDKLFEELDKVAEAKRNVGKEGFQFNLDEINAVEAKLKEQIKLYENMGDKLTKTPKELAFAMRGLPAQFTDIFTSLQAGHNPLLVLTQQGGQIKDSFGGAGMAARQMGSYIAGLVTPVNLAIAAFGILAVQMASVYLEHRKLQKDLAASGQLFTISAEGIRNSALEMEAGLATTSSAIRTLQALHQSANIDPSSYEGLATSITRFARVTGQTEEAVTSLYDKLAENPVANMSEVHRQFRFLTTESAALANNLVKQGRIREAQVYLESELKQQMDKVTKEAEAQEGVFSKLIGHVVKGASMQYDLVRTLLPEGTPTTLDDAQRRVESLTNKVAEYQRQVDAGQGGALELATTREELRETLVLYGQLSEKEEERSKILSASQEQAQAALQKMSVKDEDHHQKRQRLLNEALSHFENMGGSVKDLTDETKQGTVAVIEFKNAVKAIEEEYARVKFNSPFETLIRDLDNRNQRTREEIRLNRSLTSSESALLQKKQEVAEIKSRQERGLELSAHDKEILANQHIIEQRLKEGKMLEEQRNAQIAASRERRISSHERQSEADRLLTRLKEHNAELRLRRDTEGKLSKEEVELHKLREKFQLIEEKAATEKLSKNEQSLLLAKEEILAAQEKNVEIEKEIELKNKALRLAKTTYDLNADIESRKRSIAFEKDMLKYTSRQKERKQELFQLEEQHRKTLSDLAMSQLQNPKDVDEYKGTVAAHETAYGEMRGVIEEFYDWQDKRQADWIAGVEDGFTRYENSIKSIHDTMEDFVSTSLIDFTENFSDGLAKSIVLGEDLRLSMHNLGETILLGAVKGIIKMGMETLNLQAIEIARAKMVGATQVAVDNTVSANAKANSVKSLALSQAQAGQAAASWSPAAMLASIGSFGGAAVAGMAALVAALAFKGFKTGGYTGGGGVNDIAGVVHGQEYVFDAQTTSRIGVENLEKLRRGESIGGPQVVGGSNVIINLIEDSEKAGTVDDSRRDEDGIIDIFVSNIVSDGRAASVIQNKWGLQPHGR